MARIRSVHPGLFTDEAFVSLSDAAKVFFIGLWCEADDGGAFEWKPVTLKMRLMPAALTPVEPLLEELATLDMVRAYERDGKKFGAIRNFCRFQRPKKPKCKWLMPDELRTYVASTDGGSEPSASLSDDGSEPVGNQFGTGGEIASQREEGGGSRRDNPASVAPDPAREPAGWLAVEIVKAFEAANSPHPPNTARAQLWISQGYDPQICIATIRDVLARKPNVRGLNYFDQPIKDAHESRRSANGVAPAVPKLTVEQEREREWRWRIRQWLDTPAYSRTWAWGPEPGQPGCYVPEHILREFEKEHVPAPSREMPDIPPELDRRKKPEAA